MPRGKITFIVEGELEKDFLEKHCANKLVIRKIPCNGENVAVESLAAMIKAIFDVLRNPPQIVVILDRENRPSLAVALEQQLLERLNTLGMNVRMSVHIADRMIENWIIADPSALASEHLTIDTTQNTEGTSGKGLLKKAFREQGSTYSERVDGVRLLSKCSAAVVAQNSLSFSRLYHALQMTSLPCAWIGR